MYAKLSILALCAAASVKEVVAGPLHRHPHPKREIVYTDVVVVTEWVTTTVTGGEAPATQEPVPTTTPVTIPSPVVKSPLPEQTPAPENPPVAEAPVVESPAPEPPVKQAPVEQNPAPETSSVVEASVESPQPETYTPEPSPEPTPSPTPSSTPSSTPSLASRTSKRGAAYNDPNLVSALVGSSNQISWAYNWGSDSGGLTAPIAYYPMLWSPIPLHSDNWDSKAEAALASGSDSLLSFNEPDIVSQANMSPADAAAGHIQFMNKYAGRARISAPAVSSSQNQGQGLDWLSQFFTACNGQCQVDFCAAHWYGPGGEDGASLFLDHIKDAYALCQKPIWITEFAAESGDVDTFMRVVTEKLDSEEFNFVEKYSYFMVSQGSIMADASSLSSFGKIFAGIA
ncbi:glycosyl hydrolase catalytic core-domain-containing protein [Durotheca rogersii]|uniref:glycosyl hydrolase catalytic core-domain-containing protein n=1 Tax=Durotheca rogersii TaxID=419775 RepID=UPI0022200151|nr:glycosyl hydrolase catalytic core-domain-containing protein [Durotheca rogersii]KAI5862333.1 glycosyl hydrolase catalytic core-domain-containing protein [Durotheca rogersii]